MYQSQGCVVIFLSYFLALLIKVDAAGQESRSALGGLLIAINVMLVLAVLSACWLTVQQTGGNSRDEDGTIALTKAIQTVEQDTTNTPGSNAMQVL